VTKRLIDVDDDKLAQVQSELGTETMKATVDAAFDEVLALVARRRALLAERGAGAAELADRKARGSAWG
jgi:Arc/MetJ family transcription regulator